jgi:hypothetical protein
MKQFKKNLGNTRRTCHYTLPPPQDPSLKPPTYEAEIPTLYYGHDCTDVFRYVSCFGRHLLIYICDINKKAGNSSLLVCYAVSFGKYLPTFKDRCVFVFGVNQSKKCCELTGVTLHKTLFAVAPH